MNIDSKTIKPWHVFTMLMIFLCSWVYTEVSEYISRREFVAEVDAFMKNGDRFTAQEGVELEKRIENLEEKTQ